MDKIRNVTGMIFIIVAIGLSILGIFGKVYFLLIYSVVLVIIGVLLLMDIGKEEHIEPIKNSKLTIKKQRNKNRK